jgi:drug/metabolite transporter (DMT)-like permease
MALQGGSIDAASFTGIRLVSGAIVLAILARGRGEGGSWLSAAALFAYAAAFSFAYLRIPAGLGALILFGVVQVTMIGWGWIRGARPGVLEWIGLAVAFGGLVVLARPGLTAPDPAGAGLMALAGVAWGVYSLRGRTTQRPLAATAGNFVRSVPAALLLVAIAFPHVKISATGTLLAILSGAIASGVGYSLWYAALPHLPATRAAVIQLAVPLLAAAGGVALLGEAPSLRLAISAFAILGGVALVWRGRSVRPS